MTLLKKHKCTFKFQIACVQSIFGDRSKIPHDFFGLHIHRKITPSTFFIVGMKSESYFAYF